MPSGLILLLEFYLFAELFGFLPQEEKRDSN
jgi:hypothetical protein